MLTFRNHFWIFLVDSLTVGSSSNSHLWRTRCTVSSERSDTVSFESCSGPLLLLLLSCIMFKTKTNFQKPKSTKSNQTISEIPLNNNLSHQTQLKQIAIEFKPLESVLLDVHLLDVHLAEPFLDDSGRLVAHFCFDDLE